MAAAFDRAGFDAYDVHMSDLAAGRRSLGEFKGFVAGGGFSYGDVLGAGEGWAKSILFNRFGARPVCCVPFARTDSFALGVCNGCQMMSNLRELVPGTAHWPHFVRNASEQFEARLVLVEVQRSPSLFFAGMDGSRIPGGDRARRRLCRISRSRRSSPPRSRWSRCALSTIAARPTETYPYNCNGSPQGITGPHDGGRPLHDPDAASGTRAPVRADVLASRGLGRRVAMDAHVPQRARLARDELRPQAKRATAWC